MSPKEILRSALYRGITDSINRDPENPGLYLTRAMRLSQNKQLELATEDYRKSWELSQDQGIALEYVSNLLLTNRVQQAFTLLNECIVKFPENPDFRRRLAEVYSETESTEKAIQQYDTILQNDPENFEAWYDKGTLLAKIYDTAGAINALERSFALQPVSYSGLALATLYSYTKNPKALEICDLLIARDTSGSQTDAVFAKGLYYTETRQYDKAIAQFDECIRRDWKLTDAYIEKGIIFYSRKQLDTALSVFNMSVTVSNTNADGYFWIGRCYEEKGDTSKAIENYERALSLDKNFPEAARRLVELKK
jgi:tetratricopeptide (TPR) repeat protein